MFASRENFSFEIETLMHSGHRHEGEVYPVIVPSADADLCDYPTPEYPSDFKSRSRHPSKQGEASRAHHDSFDSCSSGDEQQLEVPADTALHVCGADIGDLPTEYLVEGLKPNEFPVIGTYVDKRILPGFRYRVRKLGQSSSTRYLFKGKALTLQNIGMGYGKRITFEGETLNYNSNYFYSDTNPAGFAFSLVAAEPGDVFTVTETDSDHPVAEASLLDVMSERELDTEVMDDGSVVKKVAVTFSCVVDHSGDQHGLMPLYSQERLRTTALAYVVKERRARKAYTTTVENVELQHHSLVTFRA